ncbi:MAG: undecaprenyl-diphosphate phosphatase [Oscillospiraceae bacterium]
MFLSDRFGHGTRTAEQMTVKDAVTVGLFQVVALFPGVSGAAPQRRADCSPVLKRKPRSHSRLSWYPRDTRRQRTGTRRRAAF